VRTGARLSLFALLLVAVFAGAALLGGAVDPSASDGNEGHVDGGDAGSAQHPGGHGEEAESPAATPPGLAVAHDGYRLVLERSMYTSSDRGQQFAFQIVGDRARPVRDFEVEHGKRMHLIVVRRDLEHFQHLHPRLRDDGTWTGRVNFASGGSYRVFTDFTRHGKQSTLGADVQVAGDFRPERLPRPAHTVRSDGGLKVTLRADDVSAGSQERLGFEVRDDGRLVNDRLDPYLGAKGHLVALRQGDLAYLHTHPEGDELAFATTYPSAGAYRLFVQFSFKGRVHTAAFTRRVAQ
jgi:hypothetical protein